MEDLPDFSPDGERIVFRSSRSGNSEAWIADADGKNLRQITDSNRQFGAERFSPDGTNIAFHARSGENKDIYVASVESGGEPRLLTTEAANNTFPAWSANGKFIYFASDRSGANQLWRVPSVGGDAVQITRDGGLESAASNSDETQISRLNNEGFRNLWSLTKKGIYFVANADHSPHKIKFYEFSTEHISEAAETDRLNLSGFAGMTVSPVDNTIVFAQFDQNASNIMLAEIKK